MSNARLLELGYTEKQLAIAAAAWLSSSLGEGETDWTKFMRLTGYTTRASAIRTLQKYKSQIRDLEWKEHDGKDKKHESAKGRGDGGKDGALSTPGSALQQVESDKPSKKSRSNRHTKGVNISELIGELGGDDVVAEDPRDMTQVKQETTADEDGWDFG